MPPREKLRPGHSENALRASDHSRLHAALEYLTIGIAVAAGAWLLYFAAMTVLTPHPIEYREGAAQVLTQLLLAGRNPFTPENQPLGMTNYGIVFSLAVWPLAALFGNTLLVHRLIAVLFLGLSAYVVFHSAIDSNKQAALSVIGAELVAAALAARGGLGGYPSSMGAFFFLAAIAVPFLRGFERWSLVLSGVASLLAFYSKPYFVLGFGIVASYTFLFVSKRAGLIFTLGFAAVAALSALIVRSVLPFYFFDTVFSNLAQTAENNVGHMYGQLRQLGAEFYLSLIAALLAVAAALAGGRRRATEPVRIFARQNLLALDQPLLSRKLDCFAYASLCSMLAFVVILGPNPENYMNYAYQLIVPLLVLWLVRGLSSGSTLPVFVTPLLLVNLALFCELRLGPDVLKRTAENAAVWSKLSGYVDRCPRILNSPTVVPELIRLGLWPIDSGHTQYYFEARPYPGMRWFGADYDIIAASGKLYFESMRAAVAHQEFDCVLLARHSGWPRNLPLRRGRYQLADSMVIAMPQTDQTWQMDIWLPATE